MTALKYRLGTWLLRQAAHRMDHAGPHDRFGVKLWNLGCALREPVERNWTTGGGA